jgi:mono/diheme cytochrome c family protein
MRVSSGWRWLLIPFLLASAAPVASAGSRPEYDTATAAQGGALFRTYCTSCHGLDGRGDGPLADSLRFAPSDLTRIAKRRRGKWDFDEVRRLVDGRQAVRGHGPSDMPVWGDALLETGSRRDREVVDRRIRALVHYLASLQD